MYTCAHACYNIPHQRCTYAHVFVAALHIQLLSIGILISSKGCERPQADQKEMTEKKRKEKTTPCGVNLMRWP